MTPTGNIHYSIHMNGVYPFVQTISLLERKAKDPSCHVFILHVASNPFFFIFIYEHVAANQICMHVFIYKRHHTSSFCMLII